MDGKMMSSNQPLRASHHLDSVVNLIRFSVLIVDEELSVLWENQAAHRLLESGEVLCKSSGQLRSANSGEAMRLKKFLHGAIRDSGLGEREAIISLRCLEPGRFCGLVACRLQASDIMPSRHQLPAAVLIVNDPAQRMSVPSPILKSLFGLTVCERLLARGLLNGLSLDEYAIEMRISINTARSHLKSIFGKTDCNSQAGLVTLLSRLVPPVELENEEG